MKKSRVEQLLRVHGMASIRVVHGFPKLSIWYDLAARRWTVNAQRAYHATWEQVGTRRTLEQAADLALSLRVPGHRPLPGGTEAMRRELRQRYPLAV
jgi:hypothetical protein